MLRRQGPNYRVVSLGTLCKIEELETNSKIQNIRDFYRDINDFEKV